MDKYDNLRQIVDNTVTEAVEEKIFRVGDFFTNMETEFTRLGFRDKYSGGVENILLLRLDAVGDFILTSAAIREVRRNYPDAYITLVVSNRAYRVAELCPYVNEVIPFNIEFDLENVLEVLQHAGEFAKKYLWRRQFDLAFSFRYFNAWSFLQLLTTYLSGAKVRVGYDRNAGLLYTGSPLSDKPDISHKLLTHTNSGAAEVVHDSARSLYLLKNFGLKIHHDDLELWYNASDFYDAKKFLDGFAPDRVKVLAGIGASHPVNLYPVEKYLMVFRAIIDNGGAIILAGGPQDLDSAKFLQQNLPTEFVKNLLEVNASWRMTEAVASLADLYVGNDTGTAHIAAAAKIPVVVLNRVAKHKSWHSITNDRIYFPSNTPTIIVRPDHQLEACQKQPNFAGCMYDGAHCITQIDPNEIIDAYKKMADFIKIDGVVKK